MKYHFILNPFSFSVMDELPDLDREALVYWRDYQHWKNVVGFEWPICLYMDNLTDCPYAHSHHHHLLPSKMERAGRGRRRLPREKMHGREHHLYSEMVRVALPTPDFSMPYNVIVITSTVLVSFFGQMLSLLLVRLNALQRGEEVKNDKMIHHLVKALKRVIFGEGEEKKKGGNGEGEKSKEKEKEE